MEEIATRLSVLFPGAVFALSLGLTGCDSNAPPPPTPASIEFLTQSTYKICNQVDLTVRIKDVNGLTYAKIMVDDSLTGIHPLEGTEMNVSFEVLFRTPGTRVLKTIVVDNDGDMTADSVTVEVEPDEAFDYWPMDAGRAYTFDFWLDAVRVNAGGVPPYQMSGTLVWTVTGNAPQGQAVAHDFEFHFTGQERHFDWFKPGWKDWVTVDSVGTFTLSESREGISGGAKLLRIWTPIPRYVCSTTGELTGGVPYGPLESQWDLALHQGIRKLSVREFHASTDIYYSIEANNASSNSRDR